MPTATIFAALAAVEFSRGFQSTEMRQNIRVTLVTPEYSNITFHSSQRDET
jgi:hypothetical protein